MKKIFDVVSFKIETETTAALIGPEGSGKSTVLKLLYRLYDTDEGQVLYGTEVSVRGLDLDSLRREVAYVEANPTFQIGTVIDNFKQVNA